MGETRVRVCRVCVCPYVRLRARAARAVRPPARSHLPRAATARACDARSRALERLEAGDLLLHPRLLAHARGDLLAVAAQLDLVAVAAAMMEDNSERIKGWMDAGQLQVASDAQAADWAERQPDTLWAVVIRPWVLVQERAA